MRKFLTTWKVAGASLLLTFMQGCATMPAAPSFTSCPAHKPALEVTDKFMSTFNSKNAASWAETFDFPSIRIASGRTVVLNSAADLEGSFDRLEATGWDHSAWASRRVVQCGPTKAHMLTTFVRYRKDGSELSRFDSLYVIEQRNGKWGITARSSFAP
ncbi:MAG: hypothetical protein GC155_10945 [Alphaproteobacteria bacterium]|nr:hypothetical protein [Alphaproteobacteria bacterium]